MSGSTVKLRPYQEQAISAVRDEWAAGRKATLVVAATGTGKTTLFGEIARRCLEAGNRVLVIAHRAELIEQAASRLCSMCGVDVGIEKAERRYGGEPLCVASVQSLQGDRLASFPFEDFAAMVIDEAHHAVSDTYRRIIDAHDGYLLGVTATADRADKRGLAEVFDSIAFEYPIAQAISEGYLCPVRAKCLPLKIDLEGVKVSHGDYQANDLGNALDPYIPELAEAMARECRGRKTVCFLPLVSTAQKMADALDDAGLRAVCASGYDAPDVRKEKLGAFERGDYDVLCNALLVTEGYDCPAIDCVVMLRPTKSRPMYVQAVGRGTRLSPGKDHLLLLDFLWMTDKHDLARPASLLGKSQRVEQIMAEKLESGDEWGLEELADIAECDAIAEREASLAAELRRLRKRKQKFVDPLQFAISIQDLDLANYKPTFAWEEDIPSESQRESLERFGIDADAVETRGQASALLDSLHRRVESHLATPKQVRQLEKRGFRHVGTWTFAQADKMMGILANNRWRTPYWIDPETYDPKGDAA